MGNNIFSKLLVLLLGSLLLTLSLGCQPSAPQLEQSSSSTPKLLAMTQTQLDAMANQLKVQYQLVTNMPDNHCAANTAQGHCFTVKLSLTAVDAIKANNWQIYFSHINPIQSSNSDEFEVHHINGDLHKISITPHFKGFKAGETKVIEFRANYWSVSEYDALPNYILAAENLEPKVIESTKSVVDNETGLEVVPFVLPFTKQVQFKRTKTGDNTKWLTAKVLYERNKKQQALTQQQQAELVKNTIIPTPKKQQLTGGSINLSKGVKLQLTNIDPSSVQTAMARLAKFGVSQNSQGVPTFVTVTKNAQQVQGSYTLDILPNAINIAAADEDGAYYALMSLASLVRLNQLTVPTMHIEDQPHFEFRGMHVDVARNFHSKAFLFRLIEQMAAYKLNKLHLHLADDEGWRIEIPGLSELTEIGSKRCFDLTESQCLLPQLGAGIASKTVNGYYSVADYLDILRFAKQHHIQVIPSMDMPGHSRAAVVSMNARYKKYMQQEKPELAKQYLLSDFNDKTQYQSVQFYNDNTLNVCQESSFQFVDKVISELQKMHRQAGASLTRYHIGADETAGAWVESPVCQQFLQNNDYEVTKASELGGYFVERVARMLADKNIEAAAWNDGLMHTREQYMPPVVQANAWGLLPDAGFKQAHELANRGMQIVVSTPDVLYFDFPYEADPKEHGYYWASRHINTEKIFQFMPDNLPIHAEFWQDKFDNPFVSNDAPATLKSTQPFLGLQGHLWSENTRTDAMAEYKIFPRLLALAERAWHLPNWAVAYDRKGKIYNQQSGVFNQTLRQKRAEDWARFSFVVGKKALPKLDEYQIHYRIPTVGAIVEDDKLKANLAFAGFNIQVKKHGTWQPYKVNMPAKGVTHIRAANKTNTRFGRALPIGFVPQ